MPILNNAYQPHVHPGHEMTNFKRPDMVLETLYVITVVFNPQRYRSRWKLYKNFEKYVLDSKQAHLVTIECTFGEREESIVKDMGENHTVLHVRTSHEIWIKENLINLAIARLPANWKYVAWIDADVQFARPDWVGEAIQKLQHYHFIQMFSTAVDLGPDYTVIKNHTGSMYCYRNNIPHGGKIKLPYYYGEEGTKGIYWHPGFAWAARREAIDATGGLVDWSVLGGGDMFMAFAMVGLLTERTMPFSLGKNGVRLLHEWQNRCEKHIRRNVGYMDGLLLHYWHGKKRDRRYNDRGQILIKAQFDPEMDLKKDWQGLYQLTDRSFQLRDDARNYFSARNEDSIDVE